MEKLMLGKPVADKITKELKTNIDQLNTKPKLAIVRVGQEEADMAYERAAIKRMESIGILWDSIELPRNISEAELISKINELNEDKNVNGILDIKYIEKKSRYDTERRKKLMLENVDKCSKILEIGCGYGF